MGLVCGLIVTGKVFSPQDLFWLISLHACLAARRQTSRAWLLAWIVIFLLTAFISILSSSQMPDQETALRLVPRLTGFFKLVALHDLFLFVIVLASICSWWGGTSRDLSNPF